MQMTIKTSSYNQNGIDTEGVLSCSSFDARVLNIIFYTLL